MKFGENLKKLRTGKKLSQEALAEKVNVSRQSVSKWETGDAYPEMNNLLELCKIFHCKMNDLVNDSIMDVDLLDEEVKKKVVSLRKEERKKMKTLSKIIAMISKIGRIACYVAIPLIVMTLVISPYIISHTEVKENKITFNTRNDNITLVEKNNKVVLEIGKVTVADVEKEIIETKVMEVFKKNNKNLIIGYIETGFVALLCIVILTSMILKYLEMLFKNIHKGETPFTLENVSLIKKMAWTMIATILVSNIGGVLFESLLHTNLSVDLEMFDLVEILFLFSLSYIFEYGRLLSLETKGQMYGDENE